MWFEKQQTIAGYTVVFAYRQNRCTEAYRVRDAKDQLLFLKLMAMPSADSGEGLAGINTEGSAAGLPEVEVALLLSPGRLCGFVDTGTIEHEGHRLAYVVSEYVSGETIAQKIGREGHLSVYDAKRFAKGVLKTLAVLHAQSRPIIHNAIGVEHTMIDLNAVPPVAKVVGYSHACFAGQSAGRAFTDLSATCCPAPERFLGVCSVQTDLYAVGVMLYQMIFGMLPWGADGTKPQPALQGADPLSRRYLPLKIPSMNVFELDEQLINIMAKAMAYEPKERFKSADEFIRALDGAIVIDKPTPTVRAEDTKTSAPGKKTKKAGRGFADVGGMDALKEQLQNDVIDVLRDPDRARALGLSIPNGLLFYGPPGCGKTFFAERFAEEIGCNYMYILCSDVASPYIHGGQEKIARIFEQARSNAPTILFLDEVEAMIMNRNKHHNASEQGEVNEFLGQLNNCGEDGVLVVAATNKPDMIDPAALRAGRLELKFYIPQPDAATREAIFRIGLRDRLAAPDIDYGRLAALTKDRVSSDIRLIIDTAARTTFKRKMDHITQAVLEEAIRSVEPTVSADEIRRCEQQRDTMMGKKMRSQTIGFK